MTGKRFSYEEVNFCNDNITGNQFDLTNPNEMLDLLNSLADENEQLKNEIEKIAYANEDLLKEKKLWKKLSDEYAKLYKENEQLKEDNLLLIDDSEQYRKLSIQFDNRNKELISENEQLKSENKRLIDKLNKTALELVDECISQGKATEISEMSYRDFLDYRAENGKPMELQL